MANPPSAALVTQVVTLHKCFFLTIDRPGFDTHPAAAPVDRAVRVDQEGVGTGASNEDDAARVGSGGEGADCVAADAVVSRQAGVGVLHVRQQRRVGLLSLTPAQTQPQSCTSTRHTVIINNNKYMSVQELRSTSMLSRYS